eukprot:symbB.v1.2.020693.t1/scaffold1738.1/size103804/5
MAPVLEGKAPIPAIATTGSSSEAWIAGTTGLLPALFVLGCLWRYRGAESCLDVVKVVLVIASALSFPVTCFMAGNEGGLVCGLNAGMVDPLGASILANSLLWHHDGHMLLVRFRDALHRLGCVWTSPVANAFCTHGIGVRMVVFWKAFYTR